MLHVEERELHLYLFNGLPSNEASIIENHLSQCEACRGRAAEASTFIGEFVAVKRFIAHYAGSERRNEPRVPEKGFGMMRVLHPILPGRLRVELVNSSPSGFKVRSPEPLTPSTIVQMQLHENFVMAEVRYCHKAADAGFWIGMHIHDVVTQTPVRHTEGEPHL